MSKLHVNDIDLYYETAGQGQPILFIHGLGSSARDWEKQIPFFSPNHQTVTFDLRGHGQSQKPAGPYSISLFASDAAELIKSLGIAPVHVVGISLGGMIAFQLAVDHPELIKKLVIVNSGTEVVPHTIKDHWQIFLRFAVLRLFGMKRTGEFLSSRLFPKAEQASLRQMFIDRWAGNDPQAYLETLRAIVGWSVTDSIQEIKLSTLVVASDEDYTSVASKEEFVSRMPHAELKVIEDARHALTVERPKEFNEAVASFLAKE